MKSCYPEANSKTQRLYLKKFGAGQIFMIPKISRWRKSKPRKLNYQKFIGRSKLSAARSKINILKYYRENRMYYVTSAKLHFDKMGFRKSSRDNSHNKGPSGKH